MCAALLPQLLLLLLVLMVLMVLTVLSVLIVLLIALLVLVLVLVGMAVRADWASNSCWWAAAQCQSAPAASAREPGRGAA